MGLKTEKIKPQFKKGELVYFKFLTYRIIDIMYEKEDFSFWYRLRKDGHLIAVWVKESELESTRIDTKDNLRGLFKILG